MIRKIITIDENKCDGCGICVTACHEEAIGIVEGKVKLLRDDYCDGLGDCLPNCPVNAISFEEREALEYNEAEVKRNMALNRKKLEQNSEELLCGCPGSQSKIFDRKPEEKKEIVAVSSKLNQWPVQIKLVPVNAPYFENSNLLIAADCSAFAYGNFHNEFMKNRITLIGCPKLDEGNYSEKLTEILQNNDIKSVTIVRMEVPCCGGIENAVKEALKNCGKMIPWGVITITTDGKIKE